MDRFPRADHGASGAGMALGNNASAGKRKSGKRRKRRPWVRAVVVEAARAAGRTKTVDNRSFSEYDNCK
jgi:transposase